MHTPEGETAEFASQPQLAELFQSTATWLEAHRSLDFPAHVTVSGQINGEPVTQADPCYDVTVAGERVRSVLPQAADALELGDSLRLEYSIAHWFPAEADQPPVRASALCGFVVGKSPATSLEKEILTVAIEGDGTGQTPHYAVTRTPQFRPDAPESRMRESTSPLQRFLGALASLDIEERLGLNALTTRECQALQRIVDRLDDLV